MPIFDIEATWEIRWTGMVRRPSRFYAGSDFVLMHCAANHQLSDKRGNLNVCGLIMDQRSGQTKRGTNRNCQQGVFRQSFRQEDLGLSNLTDERATDVHLSGLLQVELRRGATRDSSKHGRLIGKISSEVNVGRGTGIDCARCACSASQRLCLYARSHLQQ